MKMNKLAAGALALALGLGAVAPAVAAEAKSGTQLTAEAYNEQLAEANKFYQLRKQAMADVEAAKARIKAAEAALKAAEKAYEDAKEESTENLAKDLAKDAAEAQAKVDAAQKDYDAKKKAAEGKADDSDEKKAEKEAEAKLIAAKAVLKSKEADLNSVTSESKKSAQYLALAKLQKRAVAVQAEKVEAARKAVADNKDKTKKAELDQKVIEENNKLLAENAKYEELLADFGKALEKEEAERGKLDVQPKLSEKQQALVEVVRAQNELSAANGAYGTAVAKEEAAKERYKTEYGLLEERAKGAGVIVTIENDKIVVKPSIKDADKIKKDNLTELKRAREEALTSIKAVKLLKELSPEKIKNVEAKLNALVAKNEELVKKADAKLAKAKVAFVATAYADEEADDTDALIKELDSTTSEIKELIKDKPEEKKEEEKKPEEKKEEKTPSKKAGNNARTGIAGVAGVAGILAAASVAYAASKRD